MIAAAKTQVEPGVYRQMPDAEYRAIDALSNSDLVAWAKGEQDKGIDPRNAIFGTAFHGIVLEPEVAKQKLVCLEPKQKRASYDGPDDMWVLTNSEYAKLMGCYHTVSGNKAAGIEPHPQLGPLMKLARSSRGNCEVVVVWIDERSGIKCKAKIDQITDNAVYDWKTTNSEPDSFSYSIGAFMYFVQAAHYLIGAKMCGVEVENFRFACVSKRKDKGHVGWIQEVSPDLMSAGIKTREILLGLYAKEQNNENQ